MDLGRLINNYSSWSIILWKNSEWYKKETILKQYTSKALHGGWNFTGENQVVSVFLKKMNLFYRSYNTWKEE